MDSKPKLETGWRHVSERVVDLFSYKMDVDYKMTPEDKRKALICLLGKELADIPDDKIDSYVQEMIVELGLVRASVQVKKDLNG